MSVLKKIGINANINIIVPSEEETFTNFLTRSGTFKDEDLLVNSNGIRLVPKNGEEKLTLIKPFDGKLSLVDLDAIKVIGKGNSGTVQLACHKWSHQFFALKAIQMNVDESIRKQVMQELKINLSSQCPYIVLFYDAFYVDGHISLVLEYMDGGSLADFLKKVKTIPEKYLASICEQVLKGLVYLHHEKHIIHRDLKPSNLLINHRGEVKITDFGVSAILENSCGKRETFVGTVTYMSPERLNAESYTCKADIWSLGLVLLECATGSFPFTQDGGWSNFYQLLEAIVERPQLHAPPDQFSPEFCSFISSCVQKNPEDRMTAHALLSHPFLSMHQKIDLSSYFAKNGTPLATF